MMIIDKLSEWYSQRELELIQKGNTQEEEKDYLGAVDTFSKVIELNNKGPYAFAKRGSLLYELEKMELALDDLNMALKLKPDSPNTIWLRAEVKEELNYLDEAVDDYESYIELIPDDTEAYYMIALIYDFQKKLDGIKKIYLKAKSNNALNDDLIEKYNEYFF